MLSKQCLAITLATCLAITLGGCANMSPEAKESLEDFRGALPKFLRGDAVPLEEQPMPSLGGRWSDKDYTQLNITLSQSGSNLSIKREGDRQGVIVKEQLNLSMTGRAIKGNIIDNDPNQIRATKGACVGAVSKDSQSIRLSCDLNGETFPVNLQKS